MPKKSVKRSSRKSANRSARPKKTNMHYNKLEEFLFGAILVGSFVFGVDLVSNNITGSAIASGNTPVDIGAGILLLMAAIAGISFLLRINPRPVPRPERKITKKKK